MHWHTVVDCELIGWTPINEGRERTDERGVLLHSVLFLPSAACSVPFSPACSAQRRDLPYLPWLSTPLWKQWEDGEMQKEKEGERMKGKQLLPLNWCSSYRDIIQDMFSDSAIKELLGNNYSFCFFMYIFIYIFYIYMCECVREIIHI